MQRTKILNVDSIKLNGVEIKLSNIVYFLFFFTILFILLNMTDNFPLSYQLQWFKYVYVAAMLVINIAYVRVENFHAPVIIYLGLIFLHTFLFCFIFTNESIIEETQEHFKNVLIFYAIAILTARYCYWSKTKIKLFVTAFYSFMVFLIWCYITHFSGFLPLRYLFQIPGIISGSVEYGVTYGTGSYNYIANMINCTIVLLFTLIIYRNQLTGLFKKYQKVIFPVSAIFLLLMLVSTTGRAEMIVLFVFGVVVFWLFYIRKYIKLKSSKTNLILYLLFTFILLAMIVWLISFTFEEGGLSNRSGNLTINLEAFKEYGNMLFGMGYADHYAFLSNIYGYRTTACDVYYLYYFFSTGIVGIMLIGLSLLYLAYQIFFGKVKDKKFKYIMIAILIMSLVNGMYHCCINDYYYTSCYIYTTLFIVYLYEVEPRKKKKSMLIKF